MLIQFAADFCIPYCSILHLALRAIPTIAKRI